MALDGAEAGLGEGRAVAHPLDFYRAQVTGMNISGEELFRKQIEAAVQADVPGQLREAVRGRWGGGIPEAVPQVIQIQPKRRWSCLRGRLGGPDYEEGAAEVFLQEEREYFIVARIYALWTGSPRRRGSPTLEWVGSLTTKTFEGIDH